VINSCVLVGRIASDPEMRYTTSGMAVTNFRLAVSRQRKSQDGQDDTDWLDIVAFAKSAEFVAQYLDKGSLVGVEGRIQTRQWQTQEGQKRTSVEIVANTVQALESRQEAERRRAAKGVTGPAAPPMPPQGGYPQQAPGGYPQQGGQPVDSRGPAMPPPPADFDEDPFGDQ